VIDGTFIEIVEKFNVIHIFYFVKKKKKKKKECYETLLDNMNTNGSPVKHKTVK
jgi:hypothetical protein